MISLLIINTSDSVMIDWLNALRDAGLAVHEDSVSIDQACSQLTQKPAYDLIIYRHDGSADQALVDCLQQSTMSSPVILASDSPETALFEKYVSAGVKDIFQTADLKHLIFIAQREISNNELKHNLENLKQQFLDTQTRYKNLLDSSEEAIAYIQDGMHMHINPAYQSVFGYVDEDDLLIKPMTDLISAEYQEFLKQSLKAATQSTNEQHIELECIRSDDQRFMALISLVPATYEGEQCLQVKVENLELQHKVRQLSGQDPQTGLYSRHNFMLDLQQSFESKDPQAGFISLLYIMVDSFEEMKNRHGLISSDQILQEISQLLQTQTRNGMTLYRFGDHSFTVLIFDDDDYQAKLLAESFIRKIAEHNFTQLTGDVSPTLSIGLSSAENHQADREQSANNLLNQAYQACREIYTNAGNGFLTYENLDKESADDDEIDAIDDTTHLKELLTYALEHDRYRLVYQPIVSILGDTSENYAVLLRLLNNDNEEITPRHFLKVAVQNNIMTDIDRWVIKHAIEEIALRRRDNNRLNFFIQLSEAAIQDDTILLWIVDCLREVNAKGSWLTFQFNLPDIFDHILAAEKLIEGLKKINCNIALTQFENSKHSRQLLEKIPVDIIKLHHSVIANIDNEVDMHEQLDELNKITLEQKIKVVATKIENPEMLSILWQTGINYIQGFSLQEPVTVIAYEQ